MKWTERIGTAVGLIGMVIFLYAGGRYVQETATELTNRLWIAGAALGIFGAVLVNIKSEWLFRE